MSKGRRKFTAEQKAHAVRMVKEVGNAAEVSRRLEIDRSVLRSWVRQSEIDAGRGSAEALTTAEKAEIRELKRRADRLEQENAFLKKAAAFFAAQTTPRGSN